MSEKNSKIDSFITITKFAKDFAYLNDVEVNDIYGLKVVEIRKLDNGEQLNLDLVKINNIKI